MILESMEKQIQSKAGMEQISALMSLAGDINGSLAKPIRDKNQEQLRQGMMMFAAGLESAAQTAYNGNNNASLIRAAFDTAATYIKDYLGVADEGPRYDPYAEMKKGAPPTQPSMAERSLEEKPLSKRDTEYIYDPNLSEGNRSYVPGALNAQGEVQRIKVTQSQQIKGLLPYGEVYSDYYLDYLRTLEDEAFPASLREAAEAYIQGLD